MLKLNAELLSIDDIESLTLDKSTPVSACTAGGMFDNNFVTSVVVLSSPRITIESVLASGAATSAAT